MGHTRACLLTWQIKIFKISKFKIDDNSKFLLILLFTQNSVTFAYDGLK